MILLWHIVRKDMRRLALPWAAWLALLAGGMLWTRIHDFAGPTRFPLDGWSFDPAMLGRVLLVAECLGAFLLAGGLMLQDPVMGSTSQWLTRPVSRYRMLAAKLIGALVVVGAAPVVVLVLTSWASGASSADAATAVRTLIYWFLWLAMPGLAIASLSRDFGRFVLVAAFLAVMHFACGAYIATARWVGPIDDGVRMSRAILIQYPIWPYMAAVFATSYATRNPRVGAWMIGVGLAATLSVRVAWPVNFSSASSAARGEPPAKVVDPSPAASPQR